MAAVFTVMTTKMEPFYAVQQALRVNINQRINGVGQLLDSHMPSHQQFLVLLWIAYGKSVKNAYTGMKKHS